MHVEFLTLDEFKAMQDEKDLLAVAGIGGPNSSAGRQVNDVKLAQHLARANSMAASKVVPRYPQLATIQADEVPDLLKGAVSDLAWYWLRDREGDRGTVDKTLRDKFNDAMNWLKDIETGATDPFYGLDFDVMDQSEEDIFRGVVADMPAPRTDDVLKGYT